MRLVQPEDLEFAPTAESDGWTSLIVAGTLVSNAITEVAWGARVQLELCTACAVGNCKTDGYVSVSRAGQHVLWTRLASPSEWETSSAAIETLRGLLFTPDAWRVLQERANAPGVDFFVDATRDTIRDAIADSTGERDVESLVKTLKDRLVAADSLSVDDAIQTIRARIDDLSTTPNWKLVEVPPVRFQEEVLYLDGPRITELRVLSKLNGRFVLSLGGTLLVLSASARP